MTKEFPMETEWLGSAGGLLGNRVFMAQTCYLFGRDRRERAFAKATARHGGFGQRSHPRSLFKHAGLSGPVLRIIEQKRAAPASAKTKRNEVIQGSTIRGVLRAGLVNSEI